MRSKFFVALSLAAGLFTAQSQPLTVHEWGTFTSLQDETGRSLGGINTDDEPVPRFCHDLDQMLIAPPGELPPIVYKGFPACHPDVAMRLETPVIYFHLPKGAAHPLTASVKVAFRGGWLTQFYPAAKAGGFSRNERLTEDTTGTLAWNDLKIGVSRRGPETTDRVWTAPRAVEAASVSTSNGETEKFLFYRGVANLPCPLRLIRSEDSETLEARPQCGDALASRLPLAIEHLWLASFRADGTCAFRSLGPVSLGRPPGQDAAQPLFTTPAQFARADYSAANLPLLKREMRKALQDEGLFADEAEALLNTWEVSYFKSSGLRLFFMVPQAWTDNYLPLSVSVPSEVKRVMVGRLELVTPEQRALLRELAQPPVPVQPWAHYDLKNNKPVISGAMPAAYRALGRFRNTLLLDEFCERPTPSLEAFIRLNRLNAWPVEVKRQAKMEDRG
jgi:hypothetical protein